MPILIWVWHLHNSAHYKNKTITYP